MSILLKRLQVGRLLIVHRPAMVPVPAVHPPLSVRRPVKTATAQQMGSAGESESEGGWYEYLKKKYRERDFELAFVSAVYSVLLAWGSYRALKEQDKSNTKSLEISLKALKTSQSLDEKTAKLLEVCERLETKWSSKPSSFFGRIASAFWWEKTEKGKEGKAGGDENL